MCVCACVHVSMCPCVLCAYACALVIKGFTDFFEIFNGLHDFKRWEIVRCNYDPNLKLADLLCSKMTYH